MMKALIMGTIDAVSADTTYCNICAYSVCVCARARVCVRVCVRACMRVVCVCVCVSE